MTQPLAEHDLDQISRQLMDRLRIPQGTDLVFSIGNGQQKTNFEAIRFWAAELISNIQAVPARGLREHLAQSLASRLIDLQPDASEQIAQCVVFQTLDDHEQRCAPRTAKVIHLFRRD